MTIQIPVFLWTIICFSVLAFVLNKFLYKPLLYVMDKRNEKILKRKSEIKRLNDEYNDKVEQQRLKKLADDEKALSFSNDALEKAQQRTSKMVDKAKAKNDDELANLQIELDSESKEIEIMLSEKIDDLALSYVKKIVS